ncbi:MAG: hypothetical protein KA020_17090 [Planctomycetes bacterium]|nr:hypothetical protein [Planctomycetota bacterium]
MRLTLLAFAAFAIAPSVGRVQRSSDPSGPPLRTLLGPSSDDARALVQSALELHDRLAQIS